MPKAFYKHKLLLDENVQIRQYFPSLNNKFDVKHIVADYKMKGLSDPQVFKFAHREKRILVTYNSKDFKGLISQSSTVGVVGISSNILLTDIDKKLTALLTHSKKGELAGKFTSLDASKD